MDRPTRRLWQTYVRGSPKNDVLPLLAELGVVIVLFEIGQGTDLRMLLQVAIVAGARLTATSGSCGISKHIHSDE